MGTYYHCVHSTLTLRKDDVPEASRLLTSWNEKREDDALLFNPLSSILLQLAEEHFWILEFEEKYQRIAFSFQDIKNGDNREWLLPIAHLFPVDAYVEIRSDGDDGPYRLLCTGRKIIEIQPTWPTAIDFPKEDQK